MIEFIYNYKKEKNNLKMNEIKQAVNKRFKKGNRPLQHKRIMNKIFLKTKKQNAKNEDIFLWGSINSLIYMSYFWKKKFSPFVLIGSFHKDIKFIIPFFIYQL